MVETALIAEGSRQAACALSVVPSRPSRSPLNRAGDRMRHAAFAVSQVPAGKGAGSACGAVIGCRFRPADGFISFASPKEMNQRKGDPAFAPFGFPRCGQSSRRLRHSVCGLKHPRRNPAPLVPRSALLRGFRVVRHPLWIGLTYSQARTISLQWSTGASGPRAGTIQQIPARGFPPLCQAPKEWSETLGSRPTKGSPEGRKARVAFSLVRFFWRSKRNGPVSAAERASTPRRRR